MKNVRERERGKEEVRRKEEEEGNIRKKGERKEGNRLRDKSRFHEQEVYMIPTYEEFWASISKGSINIQRYVFLLVT